MQWIGDEVTEDARTGSRGEDRGRTERLIDWLRKVDPIVLVATEKERLVFLDWTTNFKTRLEHSN
jgi:hypothetical protein